MSDQDTTEPPKAPSESGGPAPAPAADPAPAPPVSGESAEPGAAAPSESTGDARVDEALTRLSELDDKPVQDHAAVVEDIHRALQDTLAEEEA